MLYSGSEILFNLQKHIDTSNRGHCLLVKILNYDELLIMTNQLLVNKILLSFEKKVIKICTKDKILFCHRYQDKILIVLSFMDDILLKNLVHQIYSSAQLYIEDKSPMIYLNCIIASINFPQTSQDAKFLYQSLLSRLHSFKDNHYFYEHNNNVHNVNKIIENNIKLNKLRKAIKDKSLKFAYQPVINSRTAEIVYYESLLRFPDEKQDFITIGEIIPLIEQKGMMVLIDYLVVNMVIEELLNDKNRILAVNISNIALTDDYFLYMIKKLLENNNVAVRLIIEITETTLSQDYAKTKFFMEELSKKGCKFAIDDFGTGYTSFKQLKELPIDIIKIDGSYIKDIIDNKASRYFVEALIKMADDLKIKTVAEFVENGSIAKFLIDKQIDCLQGNFLSPAI